MKLLYRLFVTLTILALLLLAAWFALPAGLTVYARHQLEQAGFTAVMLEIDSIGLQSSRIAYLQLSNEDVSLQANGLQLSYQLPALLNGELESIDLERLRLDLIAAPVGAPLPPALPDPAMLFTVLATPLADRVPATSISIGELLVYAADGHRLVRASGEIQKLSQQRLKGEFLLSASQQESYRLQLDSSAAKGLNLALYSLQEHSEALASIALRRPDKQDQISARLRLDLAAMSVLLEQPESLSGRLTADIRYAAETGRASTPFSVKLEGHSLLISGWKVAALMMQAEGEINTEDAQFKLVFQDGSEIQAERIAQDGMNLAKLSLQLPSVVTIAGDGSQFTVSKDADLLLDGLELGGLQLDKLSIPKAHLSEIGINLSVDTQTAAQCVFSALLELPLLTLDAIEVESAQVHIEGTCPALTSVWEMQARTASLSYEDAEIRVPLHQCQLKIGNSRQGHLLDEDPAELAGQFSCESTDLSGVVSGTIRLHVRNGVGRATFSLADIQPDESRPLFASLFKQWQQPFEIVAGDIDIEGVYRWWKSSSGNPREKLVAELMVREAGGHYQEILFSGLDYQDSIALLPKLDSAELSALSVADIDIGLPVTNFSAMIGLSESAAGVLPVVTVDNLSLSILQGRISVDPLLMDLNSDDQNIMLNIEGLDLQQIIAVQQLDGLSASGLIDGHMPVILSADGVNIIDGQVNARAPGGRIQYIPQGSANISAAAPGAELLMKILEDLDYHSLVVDVNYADDGEMQMHLSIKGLSPQVDKHRPVHFNLNLQQNLLTLLQSLRYVEGIDNRIDQGVQDFFNQREN